VRKILVNDTLYKISERIYDKIINVMGHSQLGDDYNKKIHEEKCNLIREKGAEVMKVDLILRDD